MIINHWFRGTLFSDTPIWLLIINLGLRYKSPIILDGSPIAGSRAFARLAADAVFRCWNWSLERQQRVLCSLQVELKWVCLSENDGKLHENLGYLIFRQPKSAKGILFDSMHCLFIKSQAFYGQPSFCCSPNRNVCVNPWYQDHSKSIYSNTQTIIKKHIEYA